MEEKTRAYEALARLYSRVGLWANVVESLQRQAEYRSISEQIAYDNPRVAAFSQYLLTDDAPIVLMAHEPDVVMRVPARVALQLSGHTHGGQVRLFGWSPVTPSRYGNRFAYGHVREQCDVLVQIPMRPGAVQSLNASVAGSLVLYDAFRQRSSTTE